MVTRPSQDGGIDEKRFIDQARKCRKEWQICIKLKGTKVKEFYQKKSLALRPIETVLSEIKEFNLLPVKLKVSENVKGPVKQENREPLEGQGSINKGIDRDQEEGIRDPILMVFRVRHNEPSLEEEFDVPDG